MSTRMVVTFTVAAVEESVTKPDEPKPQPVSGSIHLKPFMSEMPVESVKKFVGALGEINGAAVVLPLTKMVQGPDQQVDHFTTSLAASANQIAAALAGPTIVGEKWHPRAGLYVVGTAA